MYIYVYICIYVYIYIYIYTWIILRPENQMSVRWELYCHWCRDLTTTRGAISDIKVSIMTTIVFAVCIHTSQTLSCFRFGPPIIAQPPNGYPPAYPMPALGAPPGIHGGPPGMPGGPPDGYFDDDNPRDWSSGLFDCTMDQELCEYFVHNHGQTSNISRTISQNINASCRVLQFSSLNPLKPGVK